MSTIGVTFHNEDIHNIIHQPMSHPAKPPKYGRKNKIASRTGYNERNKYNGHQTFGLAHYQAPESDNFLKKGKHKINPPAIDKEEFKCTKPEKTEPVPKCWNQLLPPKKKNYVKDNIKEISALQPKVPCPRSVVTPRGTVKDMTHLIQTIKFRESEEYGHIPKYLCNRRKKWLSAIESQKFEEGVIKEFKQRMGIGVLGMGENVHMVDAQTREKLLAGLKENWNELSKQFLTLPLIIDTSPKIRRKMWLEKEMEQLERDVKLVENHPYIYLEKGNDQQMENLLLAEIKEKKKRDKEERKKQKQEKLEMEKNQEGEAEKQEEGEKNEESEKKEDEEARKKEGECPEVPEPPAEEKICCCQP